MKAKLLLVLLVFMFVLSLSGQNNPPAPGDLKGNVGQNTNPDTWLNGLKKANDGKWNEADTVSGPMAQILQVAADGIAEKWNTERNPCKQAAAGIGFSVVFDAYSSAGLYALLRGVKGAISDILTLGEGKIAELIKDKTKEQAEDAVKDYVKGKLKGKQPEVYIKETSKGNCKVKLVAIWDMGAETYEILVYGDCDCNPVATGSIRGSVRLRTFAIRVTGKVTMGVDYNKQAPLLNVGSPTVTIEANCACNLPTTETTTPPEGPGVTPQPPQGGGQGGTTPQPQPPDVTELCNVKPPCKECLPIYNRIVAACKRIKEIDSELRDLAGQHDANANQQAAVQAEIAQLQMQGAAAADQLAAKQLELKDLQLQAKNIEITGRNLGVERMALEGKIRDLTKEMKDCEKKRCGSGKVIEPPKGGAVPTPPTGTTPQPPEQPKTQPQQPAPGPAGGGGGGVGAPGGGAVGNPPTGGNVAGGPPAGPAQNPCPTQEDCDRLKAAADQAASEAAKADAAVTQAKADQQKAIEDAYRLDTQAENYGLLHPGNRISENLAVSLPMHKQAQALRDNAAAALKKAQEDAAAKAKAAADAKKAHEDCVRRLEECKPPATSVTVGGGTQAGQPGGDVKLGENGEIGRRTGTNPGANAASYAASCADTTAVTAGCALDSSGTQLTLGGSMPASFTSPGGSTGRFVIEIIIQIMISADPVEAASEEEEDNDENGSRENPNANRVVVAGMRSSPGTWTSTHSSGGSLQLASLRLNNAFSGLAPEIFAQLIAPVQTTAKSKGVSYSLVSNGKSTGEAFELQVLDPTGKVKRVHMPEGTVLEPLKRGVAQPVATRGGGNLLTQPLSAYCLEFAKLPPQAGTLYRIADQATQDKFKPLKSILQAGRQLAQEGQLHPDSDPQGYFDAIRQYALWTKLGNWDMQTFSNMFAQRTKKNAQELKLKWTKQMEQALLGAVPGRWGDITQVLQQAETMSHSAAPRSQ